MIGAAQMVRKVNFKSRIDNLPKGNLRSDLSLIFGVKLTHFMVTRIPLQCAA